MKKVRDKIPPCYHFKIRRYNLLDRIFWFLLQSRLNKDYYRTRKMWTGPRVGRKITTRKAEHNGWRVYLEVHPRVHRIAAAKAASQGTYTYIREAPRG